MIDDAKGYWDEQLHKLLGSYHTVLHSTTKKTPLTMVYGTNTILSLKIDTPSWRLS